jgi:hypothetical protein
LSSAIEESSKSSPLSSSTAGIYAQDAKDHRGEPAGVPWLYRSQPQDQAMSLFQRIVYFFTVTIHLNTAERKVEAEKLALHTCATTGSDHDWRYFKTLSKEVMTFEGPAVTFEYHRECLACSMHQIGTPKYPDPYTENWLIEG